VALDFGSSKMGEKKARLNVAYMKTRTSFFGDIQVLKLRNPAEISKELGFT